MPEPDALPRAWSFRVPLPVWTVNASRNHHYHREAALVKEYRGTTAMLVKTARIPRLDRVAFEATPFGPKISQDVGACYPAVKAAIDGFVDEKHKGQVVVSRVLPDDTPDHVCRITMHQPRKGPHGLHLLVIDLADLAPDHGCYQALLPIGAGT